MTKNHLPPGPRWFRPLEFFQAGLMPPVQVLKRMAAKYGDTFRVSYISGPVTFTGNPEALRTIYTADPECFDVWGVSVIAPVFGETSVVVTSGDRHRQDRKLLAPVFTGTAMRGYGEAIAAVAMEKMAEYGIGRPFKMLDATQSITLDIMIRVVFGVQEEHLVVRVRETVLELIDSLHVVLFLFPSTRREFGGRGPWARNQRAVRALNSLIIDQIRSRRDATEGARDVLGLMMNARYDDGSAMSEDELLDHLRGLLFAGHEATATVLAWLFHWLHREPAIYDEVMHEIEGLGPDPTPEAIAALPYLEAVCKETLRLYPPVVDPARIVRKPFELAGYTIPAREALRASIALVHAREDLYPEPERFKPERFLGRKYSLFEYIPFGGGARRCLGAAFAMYEIKVVVAMILRNYSLRLEEDSKIVHARRGLTLGPRGGVPMSIEERRLPKQPLLRFANASRKAQR